MWPVSAVGGAKERIMGDERLWEQVRKHEDALARRGPYFGPSLRYGGPHSGHG